MATTFGNTSIRNRQLEFAKSKSLGKSTQPTTNTSNPIQNDLSRAYSNYSNARRTASLSPSNMGGIFGEIDNIRNQISQQPAQFSYDPNTDPQYQAALRQARMNSQQAAGNIAADMNKRGLLNSTITADRGNQAAQQEYARVSDTLLPQLMQQAYGRYIDQQNSRRQSLMDQAELLGNQYGIAYDERNYTDTRNDLTYEREQAEKQGRIDLANQLSEKYGIVVQPKMDAKLVYDQVQGLTPVAEQEARLEGLWDVAKESGYFPDELADYYGVQRGLSTIQARQLGIDEYNAQTSRMNANTSAGRLNLDRSNTNRDNLIGIWDRTGVAPSGIDGVAPGTPLFDQTANQPQQGGSLTANQFLESVQSQYLEPVMDEYGTPTGQSTMPADPARREQMFLQVVDAGYDDATTYQLLGALGFTGNEINQYLNKYSGQ